VYLWTTVARESPVPHSNLGISDDDDRARGAAEQCLRTGQAGLAFVEAARPVMSAHSLSPCYLRTGAGWWAAPGLSGEVHWTKFVGPEGTAGPRALAQVWQGLKGKVHV
jgi:hypothetical protein